MSDKEEEKKTFIRNDRTVATTPSIFGCQGRTIEAKQAHLNRWVVFGQLSVAKQAIGDWGGKDVIQGESQLVAKSRQQRH